MQEHALGPISNVWKKISYSWYVLYKLSTIRCIENQKRLPIKRVQGWKDASYFWWTWPFALASDEDFHLVNEAKRQFILGNKLIRHFSLQVTIDHTIQINELSISSNVAGHLSDSNVLVLRCCEICWDCIPWIWWRLWNWQNEASVFSVTDF